MAYNWQSGDWPDFRCDESQLKDELACFRQARVGVLPAYRLIAGQAFETEGLVAEALRTSRVEGEKVDESVIMSSVCRVMGVKTSAVCGAYDPRSEGAAALVLDVRRDWSKPLSRDLLLFWHRDLLPHFERAGEFRSHSDAMQVVRRDAYGEYEVRFTAPPSSRVESELAAYLRHLNGFAGGADDIDRSALKASLFHVYFESIHPFEDGNGRIGRAIVAKVLAESIGAGVVLPVSPAIESVRAQYYDELHAASMTLDWTRWAKFFIPVLTRAMDDFVANVHFILKKGEYLAKWENLLTERQMGVVARMLKDGPDGVRRGLSAAKYRRMTGVSKPTATRDLADMASCGAITVSGAGRSVRYDLSDLV